MGPVVVVVVDTKVLEDHLKAKMELVQFIALLKLVELF
jgi:hypothetical protein